MRARSGDLWAGNTDASSFIPLPQQWSKTTAYKQQLLKVRKNMRINHVSA
jgi:hypothetical protein